VTSSTARQEEDSTGGFALVAVLWFLVIASAVVAPFVILARTDFLIAANASQKLRLSLMAENLATLISLKLTNQRQGANFRANVPLDSTRMSCSVGKYDIEIWLQDQSGLIDLNTADEKLLNIGLRSIDIADPEPVVAAISLFRSYEPQAAGMASAAKIVGGRKSGPFESVIELSDIQALKDIEPAALHRAFTVHTGQSEVFKTRAPENLARLLDVAAVVRGSEAEEPARAFGVEVVVRDRATSIRGYSGFLIKSAEPPNPPFKRLEQLFGPSLDATETQLAAQCPVVLGNDFAATLVDAQ
jgi:type II secretory pathway component PulK